MPDAPATPADDSPRGRARAQHPDFPFLDAGDVAAITSLMRRLGYLHDGESATRVAKAGEGNMNLTLRVSTDRGRSLILKQSRPWVEKYDFIDAPWDRAVSERRFYQRVRGVDGVADRMPALLGHDDATRTLALEDLGEASDLTGVYAGGAIEPAELDAAAAYLRRLHDHTRGERGDDFANREMRQLNHAHIFDIPLQNHGMVDLDSLEPGLAKAATEARSDADFVDAARRTGDRYLAEPGDDACLLHGDFFPGSLLRTKAGLRVIDPEFSFAGDPAIDVAVMVAHLALAGRPGDEARRFLDAYDAASLDADLLARFAGCEVVRRIIGVAQLPIPTPTDGRRATLLARGRAAARDGDLSPLLS